jgi:hypothetical protein
MKRLLWLGILLTVGCCREPYQAPKMQKKFDPCFNGGKNPQPMHASEVFQSNGVSNAVKVDDKPCHSLIVRSLDGQPTVMVCSVQAVAGPEGPWLTVINIVNPQIQEWVMPRVTYVRFSVDSHVAGSVMWQPFSSEPWSRGDEVAWRWE